MQHVGSQSMTPGNDLGSISVFQRGGAFFAAILADATFPRPGSPSQFEANICAARDLSPLLAVPGGAINRCTGMVAIGKTGLAAPQGNDFIDFVGFNTQATPPVVMGIDETAGQEIGGFFSPTPPPNGTPGWLDPITVGGTPFRILTTQGTPLDMDVAVGLTGTGPALGLESWLITTERSAFSATQFYLASYYLTPSNAAPFPVPVAGPSLALPPGWIVRDMIVLSSRTSPVVWIVFVDSQTTGSPVAHTVAFTMTFGGAGSAFGPIDPPGNPHGIPSLPGLPGLPLRPLFPTPPAQLGAIMNLAEAQNPAGLGTYGDVGISFRNVTTPQGAPGDFVVLRALPAPVPQGIGVAGVGGGTATFISSKTAGTPGSPFGIELEQPGGGVFGPGWYVATPSAPGAWSIGAIDRTGTAARVVGGGAVYSVAYPAGAVPSGPILSHPGDIFNPLPATTSTNFVCMPYLSGAGAFEYQIASPSTNAVYATAVPSMVAVNYGPAPPFPIQHAPGAAWTGPLVYHGRTNFRPEYSLYFPSW
jgi:hypothetical protein